MTKAGISSAVVIAPEAGGVAWVAGRCADELRRRRITVTQLTAGEAGSRNLAGTAARCVWRARKQVRRAEVVHVELGRTAVGAFWLAIWCGLLRNDLTVVVHDSPIVVRSPGSGLLRTSAGWRDALAHKVLSPLTSPLLLLWLRRRTALWITFSQAAAGGARAAGLHPVAVVALGADAPRRPPGGADHSGSRDDSASTDWRLPSRGAAVLFAGYLAPTKGLETLAAAWRIVGRTSPVPLRIVGGHSRQHDSYVERIRGDFGSDPAVEWVGYLDDDAFAAELERAALVVLPYHTSNPASGVLAQALTAGRPIVATRVPAVEALPESARSAVAVVDVDDPVALADALTALLSSPERRDALGEAAARSARGHGWPQHVDQLLDVYPRRTVGADSVLLLTPVFPPARGGIELLAAGLAGGLADEVTVVTLREPGWREHDSSVPYAVDRAVNEPRGGRRAILRLSVRAVWRGLTVRPKVVLAMHVRASYSAWVIAHLTGAKWIQFYYAKEILEFPRATALAVAGADAHTVLGQYALGLVSDAGLDRGAARVIPPAFGALPPRRRRSGPAGVADRRVHSASVPTAPRRPDHLITVSRLADSYKGHDVMIEAMRLLVPSRPDVHWDVVGDGPLRPGLAGQASRAGLDGHVTWHGSIPDDERDDLLRRADLFVMLSRVDDGGRGVDGFGVVYLEAAALGLPVIAGNEGGGVDAVQDGVTGLLVDPRSPEAVARTIGDLLGDRGRLEGMRARATAWAATFGWSRYLDDISLLIDEVEAGR